MAAVENLFVCAWTLDDAAALLDPPVTRAQLAAIVAALRIPPIGHRHLPCPGRPSATFDAKDLMRLHAAIAPWLVVR